MATPYEYGPVKQAGEGVTIQMYLSQLKQRVEKLSGRELGPFELSQYRVGIGSEPMIVHFLAQVSTSTFQPAPNGFALIKFEVLYVSVHVPGIPSLEGYLLDQGPNDPLDPSKVPKNAPAT